MFHIRYNNHRSKSIGKNLSYKNTRLYYWKCLHIWCLILHFYNLLLSPHTHTHTYIYIYILLYFFWIPYPIFSSCFPFLIALSCRMIMFVHDFRSCFFPIFSFLLFSLSIPLNKNVDQQKQLRLIYDRFKEEVNLHLQDCRSTVEDLEADQIEIKGTLEKHSMKIYVSVFISLFCI
jgi:hypothetical protein